MNIQVALFFIHSTVAPFLLGWKFTTRNNAVLKKFGIGLMLNGAAFLIWSVAVFLKPENLSTWTSAGAVPLMGAFLYYLAAGTNHLEQSTRNRAIGGGVLMLLVLFVLRTFIYPSQPYFSEDGLFFFNVMPQAVALYIFVLSSAAFPAISAVAKRMTPRYAIIVRGGFIAEVMGAIILIISYDTILLYINGWVISIAYVVLWTSLLFSGTKPWQENPKLAN